MCALPLPPPPPTLSKQKDGGGKRVGGRHAECAQKHTRACSAPNGRVLPSEMRGVITIIADYYVVTPGADVFKLDVTLLAHVSADRPPPIPTAHSQSIFKYVSSSDLIARSHTIRLIVAPIKYIYIYVCIYVYYPVTSRFAMARKESRRSAAAHREELKITRNCSFCASLFWRINCPP